MTDIDFAADNPPTTPPRHTGTKCGHMVSGGLMSYRCELPQGHFMVPPEDPEPHYAVEVHRSVRAWQDWARRVWELGREEIANNPPIIVEEGDLPVATAKGAQTPPEPFDCGHPECTYPFEHGHGTDLTAEEAKPLMDVYSEVPDDGSRPLVLQENAEAIAKGDLHNPYDEACSKRTFGSVALGNERCLICRPLTEAEKDYISEPLTDPAPPVEEVLKQRPEDQPLPDGNTDRPDDQEALINFIAERRELGISRYGQAHQPFNGRNTLQDYFEEQLDALVYMTSILRTSTASRETLISEVTRALAAHRGGLEDEDIAEVAVDRVMTWVASTILLAPEITFQRVVEAVLAETETTVEGRTQGDFAVAVAKRVVEAGQPQPPEQSEQP